MIKLRIISGKLTDWLLLFKPSLFPGTIPVVRGAGGHTIPNERHPSQMGGS
jgi:hypothetical protein